MPLPQPVHVAILGIVLALAMSILMLAQRLGDWRSPKVARLLAAIVALMISCWAYLAALWLFKIDLGVWIGAQSGWFWVSIVIFSVAVLLFWLFGGPRKNPPESVPTPTRPDPLHPLHMEAKAYGDKSTAINAGRDVHIDNSTRGSGGSGNLRQRAQELAQRILREVDDNNPVNPRPKRDAPPEKHHFWANYADNLFRWCCLTSALEIRDEFAILHIRNRDLDSALEHRDRAPFIPIQIRLMAESFLVMAQQLGGLSPLPSKEPFIATLALSFDILDARSVRHENGIPREYRVKAVNKNATARGVHVTIENVTPPMPNIVGVTLRPEHKPKDVANVTLGPEETSYFNLLEYNPLDPIANKAVMHITHTSGTAPTSIPVDDYEISLSVYSDECPPNTIRVKFQRTYGPYSLMRQIDSRTAVSDKDPEVSAMYIKGALEGEGLAVVNSNPLADACKVTIKPFEFEGIAVKAEIIERLARGDKQFLKVRAIRVSDDNDLGDIQRVFDHFCGQWQLTLFLQYRDAWGKATFERSVTFDETAGLEANPRWTGVIPTAKLGDIIKRPLS